MPPFCFSDWAETHEHAENYAISRRTRRKKCSFWKYAKSRRTISSAIRKPKKVFLEFDEVFLEFDEGVIWFLKIKKRVAELMGGFIGLIGKYIMHIKWKTTTVDNNDFTFQQLFLIIFGNFIRESLEGYNKTLQRNLSPIEKLPLKNFMWKY